MKWILICFTLLACGAPGRTLYIHGSYAESYGFECDCDNHHFRVIARIGRVWMQCIQCGKSWVVYE